MKPEQSCWNEGIIYTAEGNLGLPIEVTMENLIKLNLMKECDETSSAITSLAF